MNSSLTSLTGQTFGKYTVLREAPRRAKYPYIRYCVCRCVCGDEKEVSISSLLCGKSKGCSPCSGKQRISMTGRTFGKWTVVGRAPDNKWGQTAWSCLCICGNSRVVVGRDLRNGNSKGCFSCNTGSKGHRWKQGEKKNPKVRKPAAAVSYVIRQYKGGARRRNFEFELSVEDFTKLFSLPCFYCGKPPGNNAGSLLYSGVDRVDSNKGYMVDNVVPCCKYCNRAKNNLSQPEFISMCRRVAKVHPEQGDRRERQSSANL